MAAYNKFNTFLQGVMGKEHDLFGTGATADDVKVYLSNAAPDAEADAVKADLAEITNENGYTAPVDTVWAGTRTTTTFTAVGTSLTITASGGTIGPFRYVALYNDTHASDALIAWWDYGSAITLQDGESFTIKFNGAAVGVPGTIFTFT